MASVTIGWLGHATVLIELDGVRLLTDPVLGRWVGPLRRFAEPVDHANLGTIDAVLLSHLHGDHADPPSLLRLGTELPTVAPSGAGAWLRGRGLSDVRELDVGATTTIGPVVVTAIHADHDARRRPWGGPVSEPIGFCIKGTSSVYFAGDTDLFSAMDQLTGQVDVALLPVAGWGPKLGPGHLDPARAAEAAAIIAPRHAIPIHWGTLAMPGRRPSDPEEPARRFERLAAVRAPQVDIRVLTPGEQTTVESAAVRAGRSGNGRATG